MLHWMACLPLELARKSLIGQIRQLKIVGKVEARNRMHLAEINCVDAKTLGC